MNTHTKQHRTRAEEIAKTLTGKPHLGCLVDALYREGKTSGMGYTIDRVVPGRGYSCVEYGHKLLSNGRSVYLTAFTPGPFDGLAGYPTDRVEEYGVYVCWEEYRADDSNFDCPPQGITLPAGAVKWDDTAEYERYWYAVFPDPELAETYAESLPTLLDNEPPTLRE